MMKIKCCNNSLRKIFVCNCSLNTYEKKKKKVELISLKHVMYLAKFLSYYPEKELQVSDHCGMLLLQKKKGDLEIGNKNDSVQEECMGGI